MTADLLRLLELSARTVGLDPLLVGAIVEVESGGYPWASNPEPRYHYLWDVKRNRPFRALTPVEIASELPPADFPCLYGDRDQEWWYQQASFGLMQVMGAVAREEGFTALSLLELCDPAANLTVGCRHLRGLMQWANGEVAKAIGAYNAGRGGWNSDAGRAYAAKVFNAWKLVGPNGEAV